MNISMENHSSSIYCYFDISIPYLKRSDYKCMYNMYNDVANTMFIQN